MWGNSDKAGLPMQVAELLKTDEVAGPSGPCRRYSFTLKMGSEKAAGHQLQIIVQEKDGRSKLIDFWEFGW